MIDNNKTRNQLGAYKRYTQGYPTKEIALRFNSYDRLAIYDSIGDRKFFLKWRIGVKPGRVLPA